MQQPLFYVCPVCRIVLFDIFLTFAQSYRNIFMENTVENSVLIDGEALSSPDELRKMIVFSEIINRKEY